MVQSAREFARGKAGGKTTSHGGQPWKSKEHGCLKEAPIRFAARRSGCDSISGPIASNRGMWHPQCRLALLRLKGGAVTYLHPARASSQETVRRPQRVRRRRREGSRPRRERLPRSGDGDRPGVRRVRKVLKRSPDLLERAIQGRGETGLLEVEDSSSREGVDGLS